MAAGTFSNKPVCAGPFKFVSWKADEFIELARKSNPPLAYASIGNGSQHHLVMEMLKARAGIDLLHVPFKGGGPATTALLGETVEKAQDAATQDKEWHRRIDDAVKALITDVFTLA